jgi:hypothetical protein
VQQQFAGFGVTVAVDDDEDTIEDRIEIMECNWPSFAAFVACSTQWRVLATAAGLIFLGLDYTACDIVLRRYDAAPHVFDDLQAMENAALEILNEAD